MDLRQLNALVAIAENGGFTAAAKALHTVQSNVSTHIARLERELGVVLVDRSLGVLTEEGDLVAERARRIQAEVDALHSDVASLHHEVSGSVRFGIIGTTARWLAPPLIGAVRDCHPGIRLVIVDATTSSLVPHLLAGRVDLAVLNLPLDEPDVATSPLFDELRVLVVPDGHPLAARDAIDLTELGEHELLLEAPGTVFREDLDAELATHGVTLRPQAEVDGMRLLASLAFAGYGAAVLPASAAPGWVGGNWRRIRIDGLSRRTVGVARPRRTRLSAAARAVFDLLPTVVAQNAGDQPGIDPSSRGADS